MNRAINRGLCWWFGCVPDDARTDFRFGVTPCARCDASDIDYGDLCGDTRHARAVRRLRYWGWRMWFPTRCRDCGKRYGKHEHCLPF